MPSAKKMTTRSVSLFSDYHMHPQGHRVQPYTQELLQPWADKARQRGLRDIAFTDHDRYHAGIDFDEIEKLRAANPDIKIRAGLELDNDPIHSIAGRRWVEKNWDRLDFVLGSVHFLERPDQMFDTVPEGAEQFRGRNIDEIYRDYFYRVRVIASHRHYRLSVPSRSDQNSWASPEGENRAPGRGDTRPHRGARTLHRTLHRRLAQTGRRALSLR